MGKVSSTSVWGKRLVNKITCPNCWHSFFPEESLFVAKHPELIGDPIAGSNEYLRFLPDHFTTGGEAIDPKGFETSETACPRCHLPFPPPLLEVPPLFISIIGSPASGKSYFLTTMIWTLRKLLPQAGITFSDADPVANSPIHEYEQSLFLNPHPDQPTEIRKTQQDDPRLHRSAILEGAAIRFPLPFLFLMWPTPSHPRFDRAHKIGKVVALYDNAGEDFLPSAEDSTSAAVRHLAMSQILMVLYDPTQDPRFRAQCKSKDPQLAHGLRPGSSQPSVILRQETILREAETRIRRYLEISQNTRIRKPLIVEVPKFDIWSEMAGISLDKEPYFVDSADQLLKLDMQTIETVSDRIRSLLLQYCPEFVSAAETMSETVRYVPFSSLGCSPELVQNGQSAYYGIRPKDIHPKWTTVPLLYCLGNWAPGLIGIK